MGDDFPRSVYWGDTHLHTNLSFDANILGNTQLTPADAYRVASGETITGHNGMKAKLRRPLDFLVVSDHAEYLGVMRGIGRGDAALLRDPTAADWAARLAKGDLSPMSEFARSLSENTDRIDTPDFDRAVWDEVIANAEAFNVPGRFTSFVGYEWTSMPGGNNLHRVVVFRDGRERVARTMPFSSFDSDRPEELWRFLAHYEEATGGAAIAIPHNPNLSGGLMFDVVDSDGKPWSAELATLRALYEPIAEVTQYKGDSETHPYLSPEDEFADYESWDQANISFAKAHEDAWFAGEYARSALKRGLDIEARAGVNPFQFGVIGSTDSHTAIPAGAEDDFWGKFSGREPSPERHLAPLTSGDLPFETAEWQMAASGYAAVWAHENTRESLFDAMLRRETYATTGPRMVVRFFAGYGFEPADAGAPDLARLGYAKGVPMGGELGAGAGRCRPELPGLGLEGPGGREPRPRPDREGLARRRGRAPRARGRRGALGRARGGPRHRQGARRRQHGRRGERHLDEHHRRGPAHRRLARPRLRP